MTELEHACRVLETVDQLGWKERAAKFAEADVAMDMAKRMADTIVSVADQMENLDPQARTLLDSIRKQVSALRSTIDDSGNMLSDCRHAFGRMTELTEEQETTQRARDVLELFMARQRRTYPDSGSGGTDDEDAILAELLPEQTGVYVDVGAWRPKEQSNTWQFFKRGWRGLLIEPVPASWAALLYGRWPDRLCPYAVDLTEGWAVLELVGPISHLNPSEDGLSLEDQFAVVKTRRLADILDQVPEIRDGCGLCSIDVEGHEAGVIASTDWTIFRPRVLIIEHVHGEEGWWPTLERHGYKEHARTNKNVVLTRKDSGE